MHDRFSRYIPSLSQKGWGLITLITAIGLYGLYGLWKRHTIPLPMGFPIGAPVVDVALVERVVEAPTFVGVGVIQPRDASVITSEVPGVVEQIGFEDGRCVSQGTLLVALRAKAEKAAWDAAEAEVRLADLKRTRTRQLLAKGNVSKQALDEQEADWAVKKAAALAAQVRWEQTHIHAPFDGCLDRKQISIGDYVTPGTPLVRIIDTRHMRVDHQLPEAWAARLRLQQLLAVHPVDATQPQATVPVTFVSAMVDPVTRTVRVQADLSNESGEWVPGMAVEVTHTVDTSAPTLWVPETAVWAKIDGYQVWVVSVDPADQARYAEVRSVEVGTRRLGRVMITRGVSAGEQVVVAGHEKLQGGERVRVQ